MHCESHVFEQCFCLKTVNFECRPSGRYICGTNFNRMDTATFFFISPHIPTTARFEIFKQQKEVT